MLLLFYSGSQWYFPVLQCCYKLIDCLLDQCNDGQMFGDITGTVDVVLAQENSSLQVKHI